MKPIQRAITNSLAAKGPCAVQQTRSQQWGEHDSHRPNTPFTHRQPCGRGRNAKRRRGWLDETGDRSMCQQCVSIDADSLGSRSVRQGVPDRRQEHPSSRPRALPRKIERRSCDQQSSCPSSLPRRVMRGHLGASIADDLAGVKMISRQAEAAPTGHGIPPRAV